MELLIPVIVSILTQLFKKMSAKFGHELSKNIIVLSVFGLAVVGAFLKMQGIISPELIGEVIKIGSISIAFYEVIYKRILKAIITK